MQNYNRDLSADVKRHEMRSDSDFINLVDLAGSNKERQVRNELIQDHLPSLLLVNSDSKPLSLEPNEKLEPRTTRAEQFGSEIELPNGAKRRVGPDGVREENKDGSVTIQGADGKLKTEHPKEVVKKVDADHPKGTSTIRYPYDGREETKDYGDEDAREKRTCWPDGKVVTEYKDGHTKTTFPPGDSEGRVEEKVSADGRVVTTTYKDGRVVTKDSNTNETTVTYPSTPGHAGTRVVIKPNGENIISTLPPEVSEDEDEQRSEQR